VNQRETSDVKKNIDLPLFKTMLKKYHTENLPLKNKTTKRVAKNKEKSYEFSNFQAIPPK